jgi:hypothetical protein
MAGAPDQFGNEMSAMATSECAWSDHQPVDLYLAARLEISCCGDDAHLVLNGHPAERSTQEIFESLAEVGYPLITDELRLDSVGGALQLQEFRTSGGIGRVDIEQWAHRIDSRAWETTRG